MHVHVHLSNSLVETTHRLVRVRWELTSARLVPSPAPLRSMTHSRWWCPRWPSAPVLSTCHDAEKGFRSRRSFSRVAALVMCIGRPARLLCRKPSEWPRSAVLATSPASQPPSKVSVALRNRGSSVAICAPLRWQLTTLGSQRRSGGKLLISRSTSSSGIKPRRTTQPRSPSLAVFSASSQPAPSLACPTAQLSGARAGGDASDRSRDVCPKRPVDPMPCFNFSHIEASPTRQPGAPGKHPVFSGPDWQAPHSKSSRPRSCSHGLWQYGSHCSCCAPTHALARASTVAPLTGGGACESGMSQIMTPARCPRGIPVPGPLLITYCYLPYIARSNRRCELYL